MPQTCRCATETLGNKSKFYDNERLVMYICHPFPLLIKDDYLNQLESLYEHNQNNKNKACHAEQLFADSACKS